MSKLSNGEDTTALLMNGNVATFASQASLLLNRFVNAEMLLLALTAPYNAAFSRMIHVKKFQIPGRLWSIAQTAQC